MSEIIQDYPFLYSSESVKADTKIVIIKAGIKTHQELFDYICKELNYPVSVVKNWDALADILRDLKWLKEKKILLQHSDIPLNDPIKQSFYVSILLDTLKDILEYNKVFICKILCVNFPENLKKKVIERINTYYIWREADLNNPNEFVIDRPPANPKN